MVHFLWVASYPDGTPRGGKTAAGNVRRRSQLPLCDSLADELRAAGADPGLVLAGLQGTIPGHSGVGDFLNNRGTTEVQLR